MIYSNIEELIGSTPLLKIDSKRYGIRHVDVYIKLEYLNPFGSIKDRTAKYLTKDVDFQAMRSSGASLIESSSGNTAKALQMIASRQGVGLEVVTDRIKIPEVGQMLQYIGATIHSLPGRSECPDPNDPDNTVATIERMIAEKPNSYRHTSQYTNPANPLAHEETTAKELYDDLGIIDYVVAGVGTGGTSGGVMEYARKHKLQTDCIGVVAHSSDFLPGIRTRNELFETALFREDDFAYIAEVTSLEALDALDKLVRQEGVLAGPTTGANFAAALDWLKTHDKLRPDGSRGSLVFVACDRLEPYMSYLQKRLPERFGQTGHTDIYQTQTRSGETEIDGADLKQLIKSSSPPILIDTRSVKAYGLFHISGSLCYPEELLREALEDGLPFQGPIVFVCPRGDRSQVYATILRSRGNEAYSLKGGLAAWRHAGESLVWHGDSKTNES